MNKTDLTERLIKFNLSRQEAQLYLCLWEKGKLTGYEAAKLLGCSRSNIYSSLKVLVEKGAALVIEGSPLVYSAIEPAEYMENKLQELKEEKEYILKELPEKEKEKGGYFTIQGSNHIQNKISHMIRECEKRLYFSAEGEVISSYKELLREQKEKGLKVVLMSNEDFSAIATKFYQDKPEKGQIRLITDSSCVLTGELTGKTVDTCLYSEQENLVSIMKDALGNKIKLLELEGIERMDSHD